MDLPFVILESQTVGSYCNFPQLQSLTHPKKLQYQGLFAFHFQKISSFLMIIQFFVILQALLSQEVAFY